MRVHWALPIVCEDGRRADFTKFSEIKALPKQAEVVELGDTIPFSVTVDHVIHPVLTPLIRFLPCTATRQQIDWLRLNGWAEK